MPISNNIGGDLPSAVQNFLNFHWEMALLALADLTAPLRSDTHVFWDDHIHPSSVAVLYRGFSVPVLTVVQPIAESTHFLRQLGKLLPTTFTLALHRDSPVVSMVNQAPDDRDFWMRRGTEPLKHTCLSEAAPIEELAEMESFMREMRIEFWSGSMFQFGHAFGVWASGRLSSACSLNFVLPSQAYAQIGNMITAPACRGRKYAVACLSATIASLSIAEPIRQVGLFANSQDQQLVQWYSKMGFEVGGGFNFYMGCNRGIFRM